MYGTKHLIGLAVMAFYAAVFFVCMHFFVNKRGNNATLWALKGIALFMWFLELAKFILLYRTDGFIGPGNFPFQLCSMPLYLFPFVAFGKGKLSEYVKPATFVIGLGAGAISILYPSNILDANVSWLYNGGYNFNVISFFYHTTMVIFAVYMLVTGHYKPKAFDAVRAIIVMLVLTAAAIILNILIPGADFFLLGKGYGSPLAFIIESAGLPIYIMAMVGLALIVVAIMYSYLIVKEIIANIKAKEKAKKVSAAKPESTLADGE